jgi:hypothetical protein
VDKPWNKNKEFTFPMEEEYERRSPYEQKKTKSIQDHYVTYKLLKMKKKPAQGQTSRLLMTPQHSIGSEDSVDGDMGDSFEKR